MLINKNTTIIGRNVMLVPYKKEHVPKYHLWMQSEELQKLTASSPLSIGEEYEMQKSWIMDENKLTFIILKKDRYEETEDEIESMIGDTNLFFCSPDDRLCAEAEVMIAEESSRGKKYGKEAMVLMLLYGIESLEVKQFIVKIAQDNAISIVMFAKLGFTEESRSSVFQEITFSKCVDKEWIDYLKFLVQPYQVVIN